MPEIIVIKVGTRSLLGDHETPEATVFQQIADDIDALYDEYQIALVASGAVGFGVQHMGLAARPEYAAEQQALSMIGQVGLLLAAERSGARQPEEGFHLLALLDLALSGQGATAYKRP